MTEREPYESERQLPVPEVGDLGSFKPEPAGGYEDAPEPELEPDMARREALE